MCALTIRLTETRDLPQCAIIAQDAFIFAAAERATLLEMWRQVLASGSALSVVIEDTQRPSAQGVVGFVLGVFVTDEFAHHVQTAPPYLAQQLLQRWQSGQSPVLSAEEIRRANGGEGLHWINLHLSWGESCVPPTAPERVRDTLLQALFQWLPGYQLKSMMQEIYGPHDRQRFEIFGARVINDYREFFAARPELAPPSEKQPYLVGATRDEARHPQREGTYARALFAYTPPRLGFSPVEQELLVEALEDATDREIATTLCRSPAAIKKQWLRIYEKAAAADAGLFVGNYSEGATRGAEKKRVLLKYLRGHPEELRPY